MTHSDPHLTAQLKASIEQAYLAQIADYVQALKDHDWEFEYSDDHSVWIKGRNSLARVTLQQKKLDPECVLWNAHAPEAYKRDVPSMLYEVRAVQS